MTGPASASGVAEASPLPGFICTSAAGALASGDGLLDDIPLGGDESVIEVVEDTVNEVVEDTSVSDVVNDTTIEDTVNVVTDDTNVVTDTVDVVVDERRLARHDTVHPLSTRRCRYAANWPI